PLIGEVVITLTLGDRRQQQQSSERSNHCNKQRDHAATIFRTGEHHSGRIAKAIGEVRNNWISASPGDVRVQSPCACLPSAGRYLAAVIARIARHAIASRQRWWFGSFSTLRQVVSRYPVRSALLFRTRHCGQGKPAEWSDGPARLPVSSPPRRGTGGGRC